MKRRLICLTRRHQWHNGWDEDRHHLCGPADDFAQFFRALEPDHFDSVDGVRDNATLPLAEEPEPVRDDLDRLLRGESTATS